MVSPSPQALSRSGDRIRAISSTAPDAVALRSGVLDELRTSFAFDAHVWLLTDPVTGVGCAPLAHVPLSDDLPMLIRLKYLTDINRWTALARGPHHARSLLQATGNEPVRSLIWREILRDHEVVDVLSIVFADRHGCWGFLDLWRQKPAAAFDPALTAFLADLSPSVTAGLRRCQAETFAAPARPVQREMGPVVLVLDDGLQVTGQTEASRDWLGLLVPPPPGRAPIPASAYNVAAQLIAFERGIDANPPRARVHLIDGVWLTLRAARLSGSPGSQGSIAVTIEESSQADRLEIFSLAFGLSGRERELVELLAAGGDTREVANRLFVTEHTVQDHLKSIFEKTSTRSRRTLLSRALGMRPRPRGEVTADARIDDAAEKRGN